MVSKDQVKNEKTWGGKNWKVEGGIISLEGIPYRFPLDISQNPRKNKQWLWSLDLQEGSVGQGAWANPDDFSSISEPHMVEEENRVPSHCPLSCMCVQTDRQKDIHR